MKRVINVKVMLLLVSFLVAFILAGVVQLVFVLHTLIMYK